MFGEMCLLKRIRTIFIIISVISCFWACGGSQDVKLQAVENLLDNNNTDSASLVLNEINYSDLDGAGEKNKFALLRIRLNSQKGGVLESDSIIRQCLKYSLLLLRQRTRNDKSLRWRHSIFLFEL
jgi:hypothetical protein